MAENTVGQRIMLTLDCVKAFTQKDESGTEVQLQRVYHLNLPYGAPYEEVYAVLEELVQSVKETEKASKERAAKEASVKDTSVKEEVNKDISVENTSVKDTSVENTSVEDTQEEIANL